jgi:hypothetical protein
MAWCPKYPLWCGVLNIPYGVVSSISRMVWYPQYPLWYGVLSIPYVVVSSTNPHQRLEVPVFTYCVVSSINPHRWLEILSFQNWLDIFSAPRAWLLFCVGAKMQENVGALVSTKMWEILYLHVLFLFVFMPCSLSLFPTSPIMCGSVGSGDPVMIIVKVL